MPAIGSTLGAYNILERISTGGMGEIYLAQDTRLNRRVALKVLPSEWMDDTDRRERFQWEAQVLATLNHPNIVTIYSVEQEDGIHFFTMELVEGRTLAEMIPRSGMTASQLLEIAVPLIDALAAAHDRGLVHRDVKPGNLMVGNDGRVKVLDFGLAKRDPEGPYAHEDTDDSAVHPPRTQDGRLLGTVAYMSPEQMYGQPVDHRADLFALGVVLYEMATGGHPFQETGWKEKVTQQLDSKPETLSGEMAPPLSNRLEAIILRCLEKDPDKRFQSAVELRDELDGLRLELRSGTFSTIQPRPAAAILWKHQRKLRAVAALAGIAIVLAGILWLRFSGTLPDSQAEDGPKRIVILPFENLGPPEQELFAAGITEEITSRLARVSSLRVISRTTALQYDRTDRTARQIGEDLGVGYLLEGSVRWQEKRDQSRVRVTLTLTRTWDDTQLWSESYNHVLDDLFGVQARIAEQVIRELGIALLEPERNALATQRPRSDVPEAYDAYLRGMDYARRFEPSSGNWKLAVQMFDRAVRLDPAYARAYAELSEVHSFVYNQFVDRTPERLRLAREAAERALELDPALPEGHRALGYYYYWGHSDYERALAEFAIAADGLPNDSQVIEGIAYIRRRQGRFDEAVTRLEEALEIAPRDSWLAGELARTYTLLRRYDLADTFYELSISLAPDDPFAYQSRALNDQLWTGTVARTRAILEEMPKQGDTSSVFAWYRFHAMERDYVASLARVRSLGRLMGLEGVLVPRELLRGFVLELMGESEDARTAYEVSAAQLEDKVRERPDDPRAHTALGITYAGLGRKDDAVREGLRASELLPVDKDAMLGPAMVINLAEIYARVGEYELAVETLKEALSVPSALSIPVLRLHPRWDPLRGHPSFQTLLEGVSEAPSTTSSVS